jgi:hypothetical protein
MLKEPLRHAALDTALWRKLDIALGAGADKSLVKILNTQDLVQNLRHNKGSIYFIDSGYIVRFHR